MAKTKQQYTEYSETVKGEPGNYNWPVRFDKTGQWIRISQDQNGLVPAHATVLLSKKQYEALLEFVDELAEESL